jgi:hypothetical protein
VQDHAIWFNQIFRAESIRKYIHEMPLLARDGPDHRLAARLALVRQAGYVLNTLNAKHTTGEQ